MLAIHEIEKFERDGGAESLGMAVEVETGKLFDLVEPISAAAITPSRSGSAPACSASTTASATLCPATPPNCSAAVTPSRLKRWSSGEMTLRWAATGMLAAQTQFRRVKGYRQLPALARTLEQHVGYQPDTHVIAHAQTA